jgi:ribonuclease BN (tRNA processing enzyme)
MQTIQPYLRSCLDGNNQSLAENPQGMDMEFAVSFLGTGSGAPSMHRNGSCTALRLGGQTFLFDVSEGTQRQLEFTRITGAAITKIFISHLHGDHLFGLVPIILQASVGHKSALAAKYDREHGERATLEIYGPPGIYNYVCMVLTLSCSKLNYLNVHVIELVGGREEQGPTASRPRQRGRRNVFLAHYPEIEVPAIKRKYLQQASVEELGTCNSTAPLSDLAVSCVGLLSHRVASLCNPTHPAKRTKTTFG